RVIRELTEARTVLRRMGVAFPVFRQYPQNNCPAHDRDLGRDGRGGRCDPGGWKMVEAYLSVLELGHYELKIAFEGLADENVWKRPAEGLLSVGELAGHIAYWEAVRLAGEGGDSDEGAPGAPPD